MKSVTLLPRPRAIAEEQGVGRSACRQDEADPPSPVRCAARALVACALGRAL